MQLTRFDRWLREKYVYETHIQTLRPPESLPKGVRAVETPDMPGTRYKYLFVTRRSKGADEFIQQLKQASQMYTTQIVDRKDWYVPILAPKDKSVTWWLFSTAIILVCVFYALVYLKGFIEDPVFLKNFMEAVKLFKS
jgi:hypothetical protein